mmetsp:Transcript_14904/g.43538  ORF Transcript_14904/g.43538 Transcript_14904/m.43538 type:complete len:323 (+) Transcript_14904:68-1036(+)
MDSHFLLAVLALWLMTRAAAGPGGVRGTAEAQVQGRVLADAARSRGSTQGATPAVPGGSVREANGTAEPGLQERSSQDPGSHELGALMDAPALQAGTNHSAGSADPAVSAWVSNTSDGTGGPGENASQLRAAYWGWPWWASCASYGCSHHVRPWQLCQCNAACRWYRNCCPDFGASCARGPTPAPRPRPGPAPAPTPRPSLGPGHGRVLTLYHQTGRSIGPQILRSGFRPGSRGWCGGAIYFAMTPEATNRKAIGPDSHKGYIIEAQVDVGRVKHMSRTCDRHMTDNRLRGMHFDSIQFNPGDGDEYVVYTPHRVISMRHYQ